MVYGDLRGRQGRGKTLPVGPTPGGIAATVHGMGRRPGQARSGTSLIRGRTRYTLESPYLRLTLMGGGPPPLSPTPMKILLTVQFQRIWQASPNEFSQMPDPSKTHVKLSHPRRVSDNYAGNLAKTGQMSSRKRPANAYRYRETFRAPLKNRAARPPGTLTARPYRYRRRPGGPSRWTPTPGTSPASSRRCPGNRTPRPW